jgi:hypothetical protein
MARQRRHKAPEPTATESAWMVLAVIAIVVVLAVYHWYAALDPEVRTALNAGLALIAFFAVVFGVASLLKRPKRGQKLSIPPAMPPPQAVPFEIMQPAVQQPFGHKGIAAPARAPPPGVINVSGAPEILLIHRNRAGRYVARQVTVYTVRLRAPAFTQIESIEGNCHATNKIQTFDGAHCRRFIDMETGNDIPNFIAWARAPEGADSLSDTDAGDSTLAITKANCDVLLRYKDSAGHATERLITIKSVDGHYTRAGEPHVDVLHAYCHLRNMPRSFVWDRVITMADASTGEIIDSPAEWLGIARGH